ncbi:hypothetical protein [Pectobacterium cacticida]|uniref:hypothetical protein n=1 Tax=Pectobacterium cacticida TaxID=69221 RepID=UPI0035ED8AA9
MNCQTDFVAKDSGFLAFVDKVVRRCGAGKITDVDVLKAQLKKKTRGAGGKNR